MRTRWKYVGDVHRWVYEKSGGRLGRRLAGLDMVLLTTTGRKSGAKRTLPLAAYRVREGVREAVRDGDGAGDDWVVVASNGGQDTHPAWFLNLRAHPEVEVRAGREHYRARAFVADPAQAERLWPRLVEYNPMWGGYRERTEREIPLVVLRRAE